MAIEIEDSGFGIESLKVKDESIATITTNTVLNILPILAPVFSSDGLDNKLSEESSFADVLTKYGNDFTDLNEYGQQNLNVQQALNAGGVAWICRLLPKNAKFATSVLKIGVKAEESIPLYQRDGYGEFILDAAGNKIPLTVTTMVTTEVDDGAGGTTTVETPTQVAAVTTGVKFKVFVDSPTPEQWTQYPSIKRMAAGMKSITTDLDGYRIFPFALFSYYARGTCGKTYGFTINNDFARDERVSDGRRYLMNLVKKTPAGAIAIEIGKDISFAFNPKATVSANIPSIEGLQKMYQNRDASQRSKQVQIEYYAENWTQFVTEVETLLAQDRTVTTGVDPDYEFVSANAAIDVDFINGFNKEGYPYDDIVIDTTSANLNNPQYFQGGHDGDFDTLVGDELVACKNTLLSEFYNGDIDTENFLDVLRCDAGLQLDANYDLATKKEMAKTINYRPDMVTVWDCGDTDNILDAVAVSKALTEIVPANGENFTIIPHFGTTTNRAINVRVSGTYEFAYGLVSLYKKSPFSIYSGKSGDNGCVKTMLFDWVVTETKPKGHYEKLAKNNRLYYAIDLGKSVSSLAAGNSTGKNIYFYANSNLYSEKVSKLSEFRNGILINDIKRVLKLVLVKYTFDTEGADSAIAKAREELITIFSTRYPNNVTIELDLYQTGRDKLLNQASCDVSVIFPDVFETWNCTIIAKRNSTTQ